MPCLQSHFIASPMQLCPVNNKRQPVFIGHWPGIQEICMQNTQLCQMSAMWCGQVKHCSASQFPHQEKLKQFALLSHFTNTEPFSPTSPIQNHTLFKTGLEPSSKWSRHALVFLEPSHTKQKANKPSVLSSCFSGCHKPDSRRVRQRAALAAFWHDRRQHEDLSRGMRGPTIPFDPITAADSRRREGKVRCNLRQSACAGSKLIAHH